MSQNLLNMTLIVLESQSALIFVVNVPNSAKYHFCKIDLQSALSFVVNVPKFAKITCVILDFYSAPLSIVTLGLGRPRIRLCRKDSYQFYYCKFKSTLENIQNLINVQDELGRAE